MKEEGGQLGLASSIDFTSLVLLGFLLFITIPMFALN